VPSKKINFLPRPFENKALLFLPPFSSPKISIHSPHVVCSSARSLAGRACVVSFTWISIDCICKRSSSSSSSKKSAPSESGTYTVDQDDGKKKKTKPGEEEGALEKVGCCSNDLTIASERSLARILFDYCVAASPRTFNVIAHAHRIERETALVSNVATRLQNYWSLQTLGKVQPAVT